MMEKNIVDISVIVPIYNVEEYLEECLESLLRQGRINLEVIMVDDGSTDGSAAIAKRYEEKYEMFHYYGIPNGGLGHARNYAIPFAQGKYIIFVDSDDIIVDGTYEKMFALAEKNNSDLTICNVARFNSKGSWASTLHRRVFHNIEPDTHITRNANLIYDTTSWNKLILKSFYTEHDFRFPENILYEDIPVTIPMHILANHVSVLTDVGYLWRLRDGASKSITQNTSNLENLKDRLAILRMLDVFFDEQVKDEKLHEIKQCKALEVDLMIFVNVCKNVSYEQAIEIIHCIKEYMATSVEKSAMDKLSILNRQKYEYLWAENVEGLIKVCEYGEEKYADAPVEEKEDALFVELPDDIFTIADRNITEELISYEPRKQIDDVKIDGEKIEISACIYRRRMNMKECTDQKITAFLYNELTNARQPLEVVMESKEKLTDSIGVITDNESGKQTSYNYNGTGFRIIIDLDNIQNSTDNIGWNKILVEYENRFSKGKVFLGGCSGAIKNKYHMFTQLVGNFMIRIIFSYMNEIQFFIKNVEIHEEGFAVEDGKIVCTLNRPVDSMWGVSKNGLEKIEFTTENHMEFYASAEKFKKNTGYDIWIKNKDMEEKLLGKEKRLRIEDNGSHAIVKNTLRTYELKFSLYERGTIIQKSNCNGSVVGFWTKTIGNAKELEKATGAKLYVDDSISGQPVMLAKSACTWRDGCIRCKFTVDFSKERINKNFYQSVRDLYVEYTVEGEKKIRECVYSNKFFKYVILFENLKISCYRGLEGTARLRLVQEWKEEENSPQKREALTLKNYPEYRKEKINPKQIVFESMWGTKYSCNPQALYEYIDKYYPEYECIWSLNDVRTPIKGKGKRVRRGSQEYYHYLATAKYFVNNVNFATDYVKRKGQIEIQTMHGTPLKTLGLDVEADFPTARSREQYIEKNARWNYLIVQGEFMAQKGKSCFEFEKETLRTGYPRTDKLFEKDPKAAEDIKNRLGLPKDKKIILYAPTWRVKNRFDMELDLEKMREKLSDEYIILIRLHHFSADGYEIPEDHQFIFDFNFYRYVEELYMISDILITDYSSVMFDYALLKKPMLFFTYDLEEYGEKLRGLYIDFAKEAPGPLLFDTDEVIDAILNLENEMEKCRDRVIKFNQKFLTYEAPDSCGKVVKRVLRPNPITHVAYKVKKKAGKVIGKKKVHQD